MEVTKWKPSQVADWLRQNELVKAAAQFLDASVDGSCLLALTDDDLKEMGIAVSITRRSVLNCIARLKAGIDFLSHCLVVTHRVFSSQKRRLILLLLLLQLL